MSMTLAFIAISISFAIGYHLYQRRSGGSHALSDTLAVLSASFWILAGIFAIIGGYVVLGMGLIIIFSYIWLGKAARTREHAARASLTR